MALDKTNQAIATLNSLASAVVSELQSAQSSASAAADALASTDDTVSAQLQPAITALQAVVPAQVPLAPDGSIQPTS